MVLLGWMVALNAQADPDVVSQPRRLYGLGSLDVAAVSADRRHLATAGDSAAYLWDFESGTVRYRLPDHRVTVSALAFSPDSTRLVTGARFGSIAVWSTENGFMSTIGARATHRIVGKPSPWAVWSGFPEPKPC